MKKQVSLCIIIFMFIALLTACTSNFSFLKASKDGASTDESFSLAQETESEATPSQALGVAEPAEQFSNAEEAVKKIKEVKAAGPEKMVHPDDFKLYEKDYIYLLQDAPPLPGYEQLSILLVQSGTAVIYRKEGRPWALFFWNQGYENEERISAATKNFDLERYKDTKFFFGERMSSTYIVWWENGDQFSFDYPSDTNILPEDIIEHLEVVKYDL